MNGDSDFIIQNGVLKKYTGPGGKVVIPEGVTSIGDKAIWDQSDITELYINEGCKTIELNFRGCSGLRFLKIPSSVTYLSPLNYFVLDHATLELPAALYREIPFESDRERDEYDRYNTVSYERAQTFLDCRLMGPEGLLGLFYSRLDTKEFFYRPENSLACDTPDAAGCRAYDEQLPREKPQIQLLGAMGRLYAPLELTPEHRAEFETLIRDNAAKCITLALKLDDAERLSVLAGLGLIHGKNYAKTLKNAGEKGAARCAAYLEEHAGALQAAAAPAQKTASRAKTGGAPRHPAEELAARNAKGLRVQSILTRANLSGVQLQNLPQVRYKDTGEAADPEVLKYILAAYMGQMKKRPPMSSCYETEYVPLAIDPAVDEVAAALDRDSLLAALREIADLEHGTEKPQRLIPYARYAQPEQIQELIRLTKDWARWFDYGSAGRSAIVVARGALLLSDTREAMLYAERCGCLDYYAQIRGSDAQTFRDTRLSDFGLDERGEKVYDLGGNTVTARLGDDLALSLHDGNAKKTVKSLPKKNADPEKYEAAKADLAELKKNLKKVVKSRIDLLFAAFLDGRSRTGEAWKTAYQTNPVLRSVASLLVWSQEGHTFTLRDGQPIDSNGADYPITDSPVAVAHPMEMERADVERWQKYFTSHALKQPFAQVWEPVIDFTQVREDRYQDVSIPTYRFKGQDKHGIGFAFQYDASELSLSFTDCHLDFGPGTAVERHFLNLQGELTLGAFRYEKESRATNHIIGLLDKWTVYGRVSKDDASVVRTLDVFTLAQVTELLNFAMENQSTNCIAALLAYKNERFADFDPMDVFTLD